jgi:hypothetical protein
MIEETRVQEMRRVQRLIQQPHLPSSIRTPQLQTENCDDVSVIWTADLKLCHDDVSVSWAVFTTKSNAWMTRGREMTRRQMGQWTQRKPRPAWSLAL